MSLGQMEPVDRQGAGGDWSLTCLLICVKFDLNQEYFCLTAFSFVQKLQMLRYDSESAWLSS